MKADISRAERSLALFYVLLAVALLIVSQSFSLLSPILLSLLISLAVNPVIPRMRAWRGGRKRASGLLALVAGVVGASDKDAFIAAAKTRRRDQEKSVRTLA